MSDTSAPKQSGSTKNVLPDTNRILEFLQTVMVEANKIPGVSIESANIHDQGEEVSIAVMRGCKWTDAGDLVLATLPKSDGNQ